MHLLISFLTKERSHPGSSAIALFRSFITSNIMPNIDKHRSPPQYQWQTARPHDFPTYNHAGKDYHVIPTEVFNRMQAEKIDRTWLAVGVGGLLIAGVTAIISSKIAAPAPTVVEKPMVVERQIVVPTQCLAFCK
ncbi:MAG: hypothetical protein KME13_03775 [Myxacorys californica WJT36-NPBG1]|jgi:hypothetical protein|nr:hypothetical protein [Myxacorys californica WJT36-NPBG1]